MNEENKSFANMSDAELKTETELRREQKKAMRKMKKRLKPGRMAKREAITGLLFVSPWILGALVFLVYTLGQSLRYCFYNIRFSPKGMIFNHVGFGNFTEILKADINFLPDLEAYIVSVILEVPIIVVFAMIIAILLNGNIKFKGFFRLIYFLPVIVVSGPVMGMLSGEGAATISAIDTAAIASAIEFLPEGIRNEIISLFSNIITILWYSGVQILIFISALQKIDKSMYEAAAIDGGSEWECFWKITLPNLKSMILINVIYTIVFISGNEQNEIINLIESAMLSGVKEKGYGYASAMAWIYSLVVLVVVGLFVLVLTTKKDAYDRAVKRVRKERRKQKRMLKRVERRTARRAKIREAKHRSGHYKTYTGESDY